ncbi:MAG TPA: DNA replication/repair protein RecF [Polyangiaceae bacterium]
MRPLAIARLAVRDLRNLEAIDVEPGPRFNVVHGDNGQGKTNLIEAIYLVATSKSFRTSKTTEMIRRGAVEHASVRASVDEDGMKREQSIGLSAQRGMRTLRIDGSRPPSAAVYAAKTPVVVFSPSSLTLSMGSSRERRALLDRVALYVEPTSFVEVASYQRAVRERQRALEDRGVRAPDLEEWEELVVRHGTAVMRSRRAACDAVLEQARPAFESIASPGLVFAGAYVATSPTEPERYRAALAQSRMRDLRRKSASIGPHRDDLVLELAGMAARTTASQGQHRALVLALKAAELAVIGRARDVRPILLLDDVSSELDAERTSALFAFLASQRGQVFLTTTRPELIPRALVGDEDLSVARVDFRIVAGRLSR